MRTLRKLCLISLATMLWSAVGLCAEMAAPSPAPSPTGQPEDVDKTGRFISVDTLEVKDTSATLAAVGSFTRGTMPVSCWFEFEEVEKGGPSWRTPASGEGTHRADAQGGYFYHRVGGLKPDTAYRFRARVNTGPHEPVRVSTDKAFTTAPGPVAQGELLVELDTKQPPNSIAPQGALMTFTSLRLTATKGSVTVTGFIIEREGGEDTAFTGVGVADEFGNLIGALRPLQHDHRVTAGDNLSMTVFPDSPRVIRLCGEMSEHLTPLAGQTIQLKLVGLVSQSRVTGKLPLSGAAHTVNATLDAWNPNYGFRMVARRPMPASEHWIVQAIRAVTREMEMATLNCQNMTSLAVAERHQLAVMETEQRCQSLAEYVTTTEKLLFSGMADSQRLETHPVYIEMRRAYLRMQDALTLMRNRPSGTRKP